MRLTLRACAAALLCACLLWHAQAARPDSAFVGWRGESYDPQAVFGGSAQRADQGVTDRWIETLSWSPRAFLYHGFLTPAEADDLVYQAAPHLKRSTVVGNKERNVVDNIRTSYGTFLNRLSTPTVETVEKKLANWTQLPIIHQEDIQVRSCSNAMQCNAMLQLPAAWSMLGRFDSQCSRAAAMRTHRTS